MPNAGLDIPDPEFKDFQDKRFEENMVKNDPKCSSDLLNRSDDLSMGDDALYQLINETEALKGNIKALGDRLKRPDIQEIFEDSNSACDLIVHHLLDAVESIIPKRGSWKIATEEDRAKENLKVMGLTDEQADDAIAGYGTDLDRETQEAIRRDYLPPDKIAKLKTSSPDMNIQNLYQLTNQIGSLFGALLGGQAEDEVQEEAQDTLIDTNDLLSSVLGQLQSLMGGSSSDGTYDDLDGEVLEEDDKQGSIQQHPEPTCLPPRLENRKHYDKDAMAEIEKEKLGSKRGILGGLRKRAIDYTQVIKEMNPTEAKLLKLVQRKSGQDPVQAIYPFSGMSNINMFLRTINNLITKGWIGSRDNKPVKTDVTDGLVMAYDAIRNGAVVASKKQASPAKPKFTIGEKVVFDGGTVTQEGKSVLPRSKGVVKDLIRVPLEGYKYVVELLDGSLTRPVSYRKLAPQAHTASYNGMKVAFKSQLFVR